MKLNNGQIKTVVDYWCNALNERMNMKSETGDKIIDNLENSISDEITPEAIDKFREHLTDSLAHYDVTNDQISYNGRIDCDGKYIENALYHAGISYAVFDKHYHQFDF